MERVTVPLFPLRAIAQSGSEVYSSREKKKYVRYLFREAPNKPNVMAKQGEHP
jgi:hypothetical protein